MSATVEGAWELSPGEVPAGAAGGASGASGDPAVSQPAAPPRVVRQKVTPQLCEQWNRQLEGKGPNAIIRFAAEHFGPHLAVATQFGVEGCTLLHRVSKLAPQSYIFCIDTGLLFAETLELAEKLEAQLGITIHRVRPGESVGVQAVTYGPNLWESDPDLCCTLRKVMPMQETLEKFDAWMTSVRREQTQNRKNTPVVQWDEKFGLAKFAPYAAVEASEITQYVKEHRIPTNPLRVIGYPSIGCMPCTRPVKEGEDPRAGRWWRIAKTECGLHTK